MLSNLSSPNLNNGTISIAYTTIGLNDLNDTSCVLHLVMYCRLDLPHLELPPRVGDTGGSRGGGAFWGTPKLHKEGKRCVCAHENATF